EVGDDRVDLLIAEHPLERRHQRAGLPLTHDLLELRRRPVLPEGGVAEVLRPGVERRGRRAVAVAVLAVTGRATLQIHTLAGGVPRLLRTRHGHRGEKDRYRAYACHAAGSCSSASLPAASSAASSSKPPTERSSMKICGTVRRPVRCMISSRRASSLPTSISSNGMPRASSRRLAR